MDYIAKLIKLSLQAKQAVVCKALHQAKRKMTTIKFSFDKKVIGRATGEFLMDRLTEVNEKRDLQKIIDGRSLQYMEANKLLKKIINALIVDENEEEEEDEADSSKLNSTIVTQDGDNTMNRQPPTQPPTQPTQGGSLGPGTNPWTQVGKDGKGKTRQEKEDVRTDFKDVCWFFKNGKCKYGKDCKKEHPKACRVFKQFGLKRHNPKGCDSKCGFMHPNACRESLRSKECTRTDCKFFHIKGTKSLNKQSQKYTPGKQERGYQRRDESETPPRKDMESVFHMIQKEMRNGLREMRLELREELEDKLDKYKREERRTQSNQRPLTTPKQWRNPTKAEEWPSTRVNRFGN